MVESGWMPGAHERGIELIKLGRPIIVESVLYMYGRHAKVSPDMVE
jgi:hypothetical protein